MNIISERHTRRAFPIGPALTGLAVLLLGGCVIQGPWDYYPANPPVFRGVWVTGYVLAGKPVDRVCFERLLALDEEATAAFPFYAGGQTGVSISGRFANGVENQVLTALPDTPNCFRGDPATLAQLGEDYTLDARIAWDSAGHSVISRLTAVAHVPKSFSIHRTAAAPSLAKTGGAPDDIFSPRFLSSLPPNVGAVMTLEYGDTLARLQTDTAALHAYQKTKGAQFRARLMDLLQHDHYVYNSGDTLFYLRGGFNTLSHYYSSDRGPGVGGVLITQHFDPEGGRPETSFDSPFGIKPDSSEFYFPGSIRRLVLYPDAKSPDGWNVLDSIGVVNTWFHTRRNRLYFYGFEQAYVDFISTAVDGEGDSRVTPEYNVQGGRGIFAGGVPDSFDIFILADSLTVVYPLPETHAAYCRDKGWTSNQDCRAYYPKYCAAQNWKPGDCKIDAIRACMEANWASGALGGMCDSTIMRASADSLQWRQAELYFCVQNGFPAQPACANSEMQCLEEKGSNACKSALWDYCKDHQWSPPQCGLGLVSYCTDQPRRSEILCGHADAYCLEHAAENPKQCL